MIFTSINVEENLWSVKQHYGKLMHLTVLFIWIGVFIKHKFCYTIAVSSSNLVPRNSNPSYGALSLCKYLTTKPN